MKAAGRTPAKHSPPDPAETAAALLEVLRHAGADGAKVAGLRVSGASPLAAARRDALATLMDNGDALRLGTGAAARYFLAALAPTAATVAARLLEAGAFVLGVVDTPPRLWSEAELLKGLPAHEQALLGPALDHLQAGRQVVPLRHGKNAFVAFAGPLRVWLEDDVADAPFPTPTEEASNALDDGTLFDAYARLVRESGGFPDVKIAGLRRAVGGAAGLGERLAALWREGRATLSLGDWSLADEATRAAAVELDGEKYLLVRLDG